MARLLEVRGLVVSYSGEKVLKGVDVSLSYGEKLVIMGPSGSGKSTLLKAIPRLVEPDSGSIVFRGVDVTRLSGSQLRMVRRKIGYLPQSYSLFPHMTVLRNITYPLEKALGLSRRDAEERAVKYLSMLGIEDLAHRHPARLSGGQQQRAALARALAMEPDILLLDEPTSALDPESRADVLEALFRVATLGKAMIVVTHEADFAVKVADRMAFMEDGIVKEEGKPSELVEGSERVRRFLESILESCAPP
ncbi:ABC transporter, ATP binding protein [Aeropyrum pernix K1]|uniref:ABC transporter, ATP binding protein n=1 Tax=Aeropyrum pernix (strain ATCC 700893 / DSM 11879 / JCM 9820 / NBRC 100138 / K1) TaxID=272557 RepID=Q9YAQ2_AERPE|nr:amino acid ABC transporter ATP-binding protein [Aeropyrum pernix]BAA80896.2 ABC transporter, ATP binding protein [Aeropyrum pernix K1]